MTALVKSLEESLHISGGDWKNIQHDQKKILEVKTLMPGIKITVDGIISSIDSAEERLVYMETQQ